MRVKNIVIPIVCTGMIALTPTEGVSRDNKGLLKGIVIGAGVATVINNLNNKNKSTTRTTTRTTATPTRSVPAKPKSVVQRGDANIQNALNLLGFDAGPADGLFGRRTRAAIKRFQESIEEPATGKLTADQRAVLVGFYASHQNKQTPDDPGSTADASDTGSEVGSDKMQALLASLRIPDVGNDGDGTNDSQTSVDPEMFSLCAAQPGRSLESLTTSSNGSTFRSISQTFCAARSHVVNKLGAAQLAIQDAELPTAWSNCEAFFAQQGDSIIDAMSEGPVSFIASYDATISATSKEDLASLQAQFLTCSSLALGTGQANISLAFSGLSSAFGNAGFGELVAAQFAMGLGVPQNPVAKTWYEWTATEITEGAVPVTTGQPEPFGHAALLKALAEVSEDLGMDVTTYLARTQTLPSDPSGGAANMFSILTGSQNTKNVARDKFAVQKVLPGVLDTILDMTSDEALEKCLDPDGAELVGLKVCEALALAYDKEELSIVVAESIEQLK